MGVGQGVCQVVEVAAAHGAVAVALDQVLLVAVAAARVKDTVCKFGADRLAQSLQRQT